jgi:hypothetical protein
VVNNNEKPPQPLPDTFADYPRSLSSIKSDKTRLAIDWTVRDVLIDTLRDLDAGRIKPEALLLVFRDVHTDGTKSTGFAASSGDPCITMALFGFGQQLFLAAGGMPCVPVQGS